MSEGGALRELVAFLGFKVDDGGLKKGETSLQGFVEKAKAAGEALLGALAIEKIGEWVHSQIEMGAQLEHTSEMLGIGIEDLQAFQYAASTVGVETESATTALRFLNRTLGEAKQGNAEAAAAFASLHVATKNADGSARGMADVIADVANGFQKIPDAGIRTATAMKIFGRAGASLIPLLKKGGDGVEQLYREFEELGGGMSEQFVQDAEEAEHQLIRFKTAGQGLGHTLAAGLLPVVTDLAQWTTKVVMQIREWTKHTHIARNMIIALTVAGAAAVVVWGLMNIEVLLVVAALALLALAVDDVITFFEGGNSVLGKFIDKLFGVGKSKDIAKDLKDAWKQVSEAFGKLWDAVKDLGPTLKDLFETFTNNKGGVTDTKTGIQGMADAAKSLAEQLTAAVKAFNDLLKKADEFAKAHPWVVHAFQRSLKQVGQGNVGLGGALTAVGGDLDEIITGDATDVDPSSARKVTVPQYGAQGTVGQAPLIQNNGGNTTSITINGQTNPQATAAEVKKVLDNDVKAERNAERASTRGGY